MPDHFTNNHGHYFPNNHRHFFPNNHGHFFPNNHGLKLTFDFICPFRTFIERYKRELFGARQGKPSWNLKSELTRLLQGSEAVVNSSKGGSSDFKQPVTYAQLQQMIDEIYMQAQPEK